MSNPGSSNMSDKLASKSTQDRDCEAEDDIHLQTPMDIVPEGGSVRRISSSTPFYVGGIRFWSATPIHIYGSGKQRLSIRPSTDLGPEFVRGWFKLPDELKVRVLEFNLVYDRAVPYDLSFPGRFHVTEYRKLLLSTPEIATMSREIYYSKNVFRIETEPYSQSDHNLSNRGLFLAYPSLANNSLIRSLEFVTTVDHLRSTVFRRFADDACGFHDLRSLRLILSLSIYYAQRFRQHPGGHGLDKPFRFGCNGSIEADDIFRNKQEAEVDLIRRMQPFFVFGCAARPSVE